MPFPIGGLSEPRLYL